MRKVLIGSSAESSVGVGTLLEFDSTEVLEYFRDSKEGGWYVRDIHNNTFYLYDLRIFEGKDLTWEEPS